MLTVESEEPDQYLLSNTLKQMILIYINVTSCFQLIIMYVFTKYRIGTFSLHLEDLKKDQEITLE